MKASWSGVNPAFNTCMTGFENNAGEIKTGMEIDGRRQECH